MFCITCSLTQNIIFLFQLYDLGEQLTKDHCYKVDYFQFGFTLEKLYLNITLNRLYSEAFRVNSFYTVFYENNISLFKSNFFGTLHQIGAGVGVALGYKAPLDSSEIILANLMG